jgi:hypothetical protein
MIFQVYNSCQNQKEQKHKLHHHQILQPKHKLLQFKSNFNKMTDELYKINFKRLPNTNLLDSRNRRQISDSQITSILLIE